MAPPAGYYNYTILVLQNLFYIWFTLSLCLCVRVSMHVCVYACVRLCVCVRGWVSLLPRVVGHQSSAALLLLLQHQWLPHPADGPGPGASLPGQPGVPGGPGHAQHQQGAPHSKRKHYNDSYDKYSIEIHINPDEIFLTKMAVRIHSTVLFNYVSICRHMSANNSNTLCPQV